MSNIAGELLGVIRELSFARELDAVMAIVRSAARRIASADGATFVLKEGDNCYYADEDAISPLWKGKRFPMSTCISGWVMLNRTAAVIEDIYADPRIPVDAYRPTFVHSMAMVPVRAADPIAAIGVYWASVRRPTDEEVGFLQSLADAAALALANVELYGGLVAALAEAERANRAKDEFLMLLSHELRTPLMPLLGWASVLRAGPHDPEAVARGVAAIERNARSELELVEELLDVSKMVAGSLEVERGPVDMADVVEAALAAGDPEAQKKGILIERVLEPAHYCVVGDAGRLRQVMGNLLSNAIKFTPKGGSIKVRLALDGAFARIAVSDTGIGLAPESLPVIFERFSRVDSTTTREHPGLGLGLAITRHLVELHGGRVEAASGGRGQGATFTVWLPRSSEALQAARSRDGARAGVDADAADAPRRVAQGGH